MRPQASAPLARTARGGVYVADGYGIQIKVRHGRLVVSDGFADERRERVFSRATAGISRLVVIGHTGMLTLEAVRWLADLGVQLLQIERDGRVLATTSTGSADSRLRRAQAHAGTSPLGIRISKRILGEKLAGQARVIDEHLPASGELGQALRQVAGELEQAETLRELVRLEREAAIAYWAAWSDVEPRFRRADQARIPDHWRAFGHRHSPLTNAPRLAVNPANAVLNYLYALLEAETRIACHTLGLDAGMGIIHVDYRARDSFVLDLMEAARPDVDAHVLGLIGERVFSANDFAETRRGVCRVLAPLAHELASTTRTWAERIAPHAEHIAQLLADTPGSRVDHLTTPLTGRNLRAARAPVRRAVRSPRPAKKALPACKLCGDPVGHRERTYCDTCITLPQQERYASTLGLSPTTPKLPAAQPLVAAGATMRIARRCKRCDQPVSNRKRALCDPCFIEFRTELTSQRRSCKTCDAPVPHRKRAYCDECLSSRRGAPAGVPCSGEERGL